MKKGLFFTAAIAFSFNIFAGGIENKTNMSTGYLRNPSRNTESSRPEACFYNIAGTGFMEEGLYIELGNQFIEKEYKHDLPESDANVLNSPLSYFGLDTIKSGTYNDETTVYLYPNADIVYKFNDFSVFANFGIYAGGGKLEYSEGTAATELAFMKAAPTYLGYLNPANTAATAAQIAEANAMLPLLTNIANNHSLTIDSITYGEQIGLAYNIKDILSLSAGVRILEGHQKLTLKSDYFNTLSAALTSSAGEGNEVSCVARAFGISPVFGLHIKPVKVLDISAQLQYATIMKYKVGDLKGPAIASQIGITKKTTFRADLPTVLNTGLGVQASDQLYISASFNYYFNKPSSCNSIIGKNDYDDSFEVSLGADFQFNEYALVSFGAAYGNQGVKDTSNNIFNPILDSVQVGFGTEIKPSEKFAVTFGGTYVTYFETDYYIKSESSSFKNELNKDVFMMSLGLTFKPF